MEGKILVFNEDAGEREGVRALLGEEGLEVLETSRLLEAIRYLKTEDILLVLASQNLGHAESEEFKTIVETFRPGTSVLFVSPLSNGAEGVALSPEEFRHFVQEALRTESSLSERLVEFKDFFLSFADRLLQIFGATDRYFFNKDHLVARLSRKTAEKLGLEPEMQDTVQIAALLKDIGMLSIQQQILEEKKKFNRQELVPIKKHPMKSVQVLKQIKFPWNVDSVILQHHENYDGSGYPLGLKGRQISVGARIVHIADAYVAMTTDRPYREALTKDAAMGELVKLTGTHFDPEIVEVFQTVVSEELPANGRKRSILIIEREPTMAPMVKLGVDAGEFDTIATDNTLDAMRLIKKKSPSLVAADIGMLRKEAFVHFYNAITELPSMQDASFIFLVKDKDAPREFKGENIRYLVRPVDMDELFGHIKTLMSRERLGAEDEGASKGLRGSLEDFTLADIVQILHLGLKTASVEIVRNGSKGQLQLNRGNIVHASTGNLAGKDAFFEMMRWTSGSFSIQHGTSITDQNINSETVHLILEAARLQDEANIIS
jgi:HD-GYP domain-containing protein (c-di-GMP phosphodiesterase class II)